jgi:hypothetical protein
LVGYWQSTTPAGAYINHITNPSTTPVSTQVQFISGGDEVSFYTSGSDVWIQVGSELDGLPKLEQVLHGTYISGAFSWPTLPQIIPGALTTGRQDPSITWNGTDLIATWWDDTMGGNSDNIFYNWTTDKSGATGWAVMPKSGTIAQALALKTGSTTAALSLKSGTTAIATVAPATSMTYNFTSGTAPATGDWFEFGTGTANSEVAQVTGVSGTGPYVLTVALAKAHAMGETDTTATVVPYTAGTGGAPAVGDVFEFGSGAGTSETRTVQSVTGAGPYAVGVSPALTSAHAMGEVDTTATRVVYSAGTGGAPIVGDSFQIGTGNNCTCDGELRQVTGVSGSGPYILSVAALSNAHASGEAVRIEAKELSATGTNSVQVAIRHSSKLGATIAIYGTRCQIWSRVLMDGSNPTTGWSAESLVDPNNDDCEGNFGGPQIAIDETTGNIHVFKAVTNSNSPDWSGVTYWLGHLTGSTVSFGSRVIIDATGISATEPPDIAGAVDSTGKVYVFWATNVTGGAIKFATLVSPYGAANVSAISTVATTGANPRYPHIPAQAPLTGGYVPLFYQSGTGPFNIILDTRYPDTTAPTVPTGLNAAATSTQVNLTWNASTDNVAVTGYTIYRDGTMLATVSGTTLSYSDTTVGGLITYSYTVDAFDAAGNHSAQSSAVQVTTVACTGSALFTTYFTWFDNASPGMLNDNIHLLNNGGTTSTGCVTVGTVSVPFSLPAGQENHVGFPAGTIGGPVVITVNSGPAVLASQRVQYYKSFNEVWAMKPAQAATTSYFNWFDKASPGMLNDNIHIVNPGNTTATGGVTVAGGTPALFSIAPGAESYLSFPPGTIGGPVVVTVTSGPAVLASQRVQYYQTFNEVESASAAGAATTSYFPWYDKASPGMFNDNIHLVNPGGTSSDVTVSLPGATDVVTTVDAGAEAFVSFPAGTIGGPVTVTASQPVLASQRVQYYQSFNEAAAGPTSKATTASYIMWFDKASPGMLNDNIHIVNPGTSSATVTVSLTGVTFINVTVLPGAQAFVSFPPGSIGGPVSIISTLPVLATQRVQYYQTFNEVPSST